jgi:LysM repeat protein
VGVDEALIFQFAVLTVSGLNRPMRWRLLLTVSLVTNILLTIGWFWSIHLESLRNSRLALGAEAPLVQVKTNVVLRKQFFTWQQVESNDYRQYIANLRDIGCPEQTIRDLIIADVNALYAKKRATEVFSPAQQWWRSEADPDLAQTAATRIRELETERRALLTSLLGLGWESGDLASLPRPTRSGVALDGPVLAMLPEDIKKTVQQIVANFQDQVETWQAEEGGKSNPDMAALSYLNRQLRKDLSQVLSPQQLEEFLLRYSTTASALRKELGQLGFNATPEEFRAMFRANDGLNAQLQGLLGGADAPSDLQRTALEAQREEAIRQALGPERYAQYRMSHDPAYRDAVATARQADSAASTPALYEINRATAEEMARIQASTNLTEMQRSIESKSTELENLKATAAATGQELPPESAPPPLPPTATPGKAHVIEVGESVSSIATRFGVTPDALRAANPDLNLSRMKVGQSVTIPVYPDFPKVYNSLP